MLSCTQTDHLFKPSDRERAEDRLLDDMAYHSTFGFIYDNVEDLKRKEVPSRPFYPYVPTDPSRAGAGYLQPKDTVEVRHAGRRGNTRHTR